MTDEQQEASEEKEEEKTVNTNKKTKGQYREERALKKELVDQERRAGVEEVCVRDQIERMKKIENKR